MLPVPVQLRLVLVVKAQQQRVKGETFDPPAGLDGPILHVLGELQNLQPDLSVVTQTQETPQGEGQLVEHTSSAWTQEDRGGQRGTEEDSQRRRMHSLPAAGLSSLPAPHVQESVDELQIC